MTVSHRGGSCRGTPGSSLRSGTRRWRRRPRTSGPPSPNPCHGKDSETADLTFEGDGASVEYRFEATSPAYLYSCHPDGSPSFIADDRHEQAGRISGVLRFNGREIPFDGM